MATTYTWGINTLDRHTSDGFVFNAHYSVKANDEAYSVGAFGTATFERPETLIPYDDLTAEMVIGWVKDYLGAEKVASIEAQLQQGLDEKHAPTQAQGVPWQ